MAFVRRHRLVLVPLFAALMLGAGLVFLLRSGSEEPAAGTVTGMLEPVLRSERWEEIPGLRNDHTREWCIVREIDWVNSETGEVTTEGDVSRVREVGSNLCYKDAEGHWQLSVPEWEVTANGFKCDRGGYQVYFGNTLGAGYTKVVAGKSFFMRASALVASDGAHGAFLGRLDPSAVGHIDPHDPSKLVFPNAFLGNLQADLEYVLERASFHQNIVLRAPITLPQSISTEASKLYVYTEFGLDNALAVAGVSVRFNDAEVMTAASGNITPPSADMAISFRLTEQLGSGQEKVTELFEFDRSRVFDSAAGERAEFEAQRSLWRDPATNAVFLVEQVPSKWLADATYPVTLDYTTKSGSITSDQVWRADTTWWVTGTVTVSSGKMLTIEPGTVVKFSSGTKISGGKVKAQGEPYNWIVFTSKNDNASGEQLSGSSGSPGKTDYTCALYEQESGTPELRFCKFGYASTGVQVKSWTTRSFRDCIFQTSTKGIECRTNSNIDVVNCLLDDCSTGIGGAYPVSSIHWTVRNCTFDHCNLDFYVGCGDANCVLSAHDNIFSEFGTFPHGAVVMTSGPLHDDSEVVHNAFWDSGLAPNYSGTLMVGVANEDPIYLTSSPFEPVATGAFYLNNDAGAGAACRFTGSDTYAQAGLDSEVYTFEAPSVVPSTVSTGVWSPRLSGADWGNSYVTIGYHHNRIDYLINNQICEIEGGATLEIEPGTVVVFKGTDSEHYGLLQFDEDAMSDAHLICDGARDSFIILAGVPVVSMRTQAQVINGSWNYTMYRGLLLNDPTDENTEAHASVTYARVMGLNKGVDIQKDSEDEVRHCIFERGQTGLGGSGEGLDIAVSNCLMRYNRRGAIISLGNSLTMRNCTFDYNEVGLVLDSGSGASVDVKDCLFSNAAEGIRIKTDVGAYTSFTEGHNAYYLCGHMIWKEYDSSAIDIHESSYDLTTSPYDASAQWTWPDLWYLDQAGDYIDNGSRNAYVARMSLLTTTYDPDPANRLTDIGAVDIGYHYAAPLVDDDSDTMGDAWEKANDVDDPDIDADGDMLTNSAEHAAGTDPHNPDTDGDGLLDGWEQQHGGRGAGFDPNNGDTNGNGLPDGNEDYDNDGLSNAEEQSSNTNPRSSDTDGDGIPDGSDSSPNDNGLHLVSLYPPRGVLTYASEPYITVKGTADEYLSKVTVYVNGIGKPVPAKALGMEFTVDVPLDQRDSSNPNVIHVCIVDVQGRQYSTQQDGPPAYVAYDPSLRVWLWASSPSDNEILSENKSTHVTVGFTVKYASADSTHKTRFGGGIVKIGGTTRTIPGNQTKHDDPEWQGSFRTQDVNSEPLALQNGRNTIEMSVTIVKVIGPPGEEIESPVTYRAASTVYFYQKVSRQQHRTEYDIPGAEWAWVMEKNVAWNQLWFDQNPFPATDSAPNGAGERPIWMDPVHNVSEVTDHHIYWALPSTPLYHPAPPDDWDCPMAWTSSETAGGRLTSLDYTNDFSDLASMGYTNPDVTGPLEEDEHFGSGTWPDGVGYMFVAEPVPLNDDQASNRQQWPYVLALDADAVQILANTNLSQYTIMGLGIGQPGMDLVGDGDNDYYVARTMEPVREYRIVTTQPTSGGQHLFNIADLAYVRPLYVRVNDVYDQVPADSLYRSLLKNLIRANVGDEPADVTVQLTAVVSPSSPGKVTWQLSGAPSNVAEIDPDTGLLTVHGSDNVPPDYDEWPADTYHVTVTATYVWPHNGANPGDPHETTTHSMRLTLTTANAVLMDGAYEQMWVGEQAPDYALLFAWVGGQWTVSSAYSVSWQGKDEPNPLNPTRPSSDYAPPQGALDVLQLWKELLSYPAVSPLYTGGVTASKPGAAWIRPVAKQGDTAVAAGGWILVTTLWVDLNLVGASDDVGYIGMNDDDDNENQTWDYTEEDFTVADNDLREIIVRDPETPGTAVVLTILEGSDKVVIWKDNRKQDRLVFDGTDNCTTAGSGNQSYWVEGVEPSDTVGDVQIMLAAKASASCFDIVTLTVIKVDLIEESLEYEFGAHNGEKESDPGAFIGINSDADSGTAPDHEQPMTDGRMAAERPTGTSPLQYDVRRLGIIIEPADALKRGLLLVGPCDGGTNVYRREEGTWHKCHLATYIVNNVTTEEYYYEGNGTAPNSSLELVFEPSGTSEWPIRDEVTVTVVTPDLDVDANNDGVITGADDPIENQAPSEIVELQWTCDMPFDRLLMEPYWEKYAKLDVSQTAPQAVSGVTYELEFPAADVRVYTKTGTTYAEIGSGAQVDFGAEYRVEGRHAGTYTVTLRALKAGVEMEAASDYVKVSVLSFEVEAPWAVMLNDDNDDWNVYPDPAPTGHRPFEPIWDMNETVYNSGENDLRLVFFNCCGPENLQGSVVFKITEGTDRVRLWPDSNKGPAEDIITVPPAGITYNVSELPVLFYVEGIDTGRTRMEFKYTVGAKTFEEVLLFPVVTLVERQGGTRRVINHYNADIEFEVVGGEQLCDYKWDLNGDGVRGGPEPFEQPIGQYGIGDRTRTISYGTGPDTATRVTLPADHAHHRQVYDVSVELHHDLVLHKTIRVALDDYYGTALTGTTTPTKEAEVVAAFPTWSGTHPINFLGSPWPYSHRIWYVNAVGPNGYTEAHADPVTGFVNEVNGVTLFESIWATGQMREDMLASGNHEERHLHQFAAIRDATPPTTDVWYLLNDEFNWITADVLGFMDSEGHLSELQDANVGWWHAIAPSQGDLLLFHNRYEASVGVVGGHTWTVPNARDEARALLQQLYQAIPADFEYMKREGYDCHVRPPQ